MILLFTALIQANGLNFPPGLHEMSSEHVGGFVIEHERFENRDLPIMHAPLAWQKVRLVWTAPDGRLSFVFEDDGQQVQSGATITLNGKPVCTAVGRLSAYGNQPATARTWVAGYAGMASLTEGCGAAERAIVAEERDAYLLAAPDFPAASQHMRTAAMAAFGNRATRCLEFDPRRATMPYNVPCARWSDGRKHP